jgi:glucokinase
MMRLAGVDIGGTKCAVCLGEVDGDTVRVLGKRRFATPYTPDANLTEFVTALRELVDQFGAVQAVGVSCGSPLDSAAGLVLAPPNLPGWMGVDVYTPFRRAFGVPVGLQNDANACALAEWRWGAGRGTRNMVFLTFGTGMGAGLILDGRLYAGTNDMAGEVGHVRLEPHGPVGVHKAGSFEGFCSGSGIAQLARAMRAEWRDAGKLTSLADLPDEALNAASVGEAAQQGDGLALAIYALVARQLGRGLALLVDVLNPQRIVIGSIYARQRALLEPVMLHTLREEAMPLNLTVCEVVPAGLGEAVGDLAGLSIALGLVEASSSDG